MPTPSKPDHLRHRRTAPLRIVALLTQVAGVLVAQPAAGPAAPGSPPVVLNPFEVRTDRDRGYFASETNAGTRTGMPILDLPASISILNSALLTDLNVTDPDQALRYGTSGVTSNEHVRDDLTIRGFRQPMPFRDGVQSNAFSVAQLYDIDRIEVIKGPAAMVFGHAGVLGGTINLVARKPSAVPQRDLTLTLDPRGGYGRSTLNLSGPLAPSHRHIRYRLTLGAQQDDRTKPVERDNQTFLGGAVDIDLGRSTLSLYGFRSRMDRYIIFNDFLDTRTRGVMKLNRYSTADFAPAAPEQDLFFDCKETYFTATLVTPLTSNLSFRGFYRFRRESEPRRIVRGIAIQPDNITLNRQLLNFTYGDTSRTGQADLIHRSQFGSAQHTLALGADLSALETRERVGVFPITPLFTANPDYRADAALPFSRPPNTQDSRSPSDTLSFYLQDYVRLAQGRINLVGGLRWIDPKATVHDDLRKTTTVTDRGRSQVHRYGIVFRPAAALTLYATDATTFLVNPGLDHLSRPLRNSAGRNREAGFKLWDFPAGPARVFASGSYFDMKQSNIRTTGGVVLVNGVQVTEIVQSAADLSRGWELDAGFRLRGGPGEIEGIVTYYRAQSRSSTGQRSVRAPRHVTSVLLKYTFERGPLRRFAFGAGGYFEGDKTATADGLLLHDFSDFYDAFASYAPTPRWTLRINVENVTNVRFVHSYLSPGLVGTNEPRSLRLTVRHHW